MPLTEQEKQEIVRYIEADKPLPDKFRFLLFKDKYEMKLLKGKMLRRRLAILMLLDEIT
jgi:hypothetical protein